MLCIGPGLGTNAWSEQVLYKSLHAAKKRNLPILIDADVLNLLPKILDFKIPIKNLIITPNEGEAARLLKANKISLKITDQMVLGADSVIDLEGEIISKPNDRAEALEILKKMNGKTHQLISSVCISRGGSMIWNYTDKASLTMKNMTFLELESYLKKISDDDLYAYNVYQIEGEGRNLFSKIEGDENTIMGLPVKKIKEYLDIIK